jgi:hypothetical protein
MTATMSERQLAQIRENGLALVSTLLDGTLLVREPEGTLLELDQDGDLRPHTDRPGRVTLKDLP